MFWWLCLGGWITWMRAVQSSENDVHVGPCGWLILVRLGGQDWFFMTFFPRWSLLVPQFRNLVDPRKLFRNSLNKFEALNCWKSSDLYEGEPSRQLRGLSQRCQGQSSSSPSVTCLGSGLFCQGEFRGRIGELGEKKHGMIWWNSH